MKKTLFLSQKTLILGQNVQKKFGKSLEKLGKSSEKFGNCSILNFPKITKNDVKLKLENRLETSVKSLECRAVAELFNIQDSAENDININKSHYDFI